MGITLGVDDLAFRCNKWTGDGGFLSRHITDKEATQIIVDLNKELGSMRFTLPWRDYRHLMVWKDGSARFSGLESLELTPPHDITDREVSPYLPQTSGLKGEVEEKILALMAESQRLLKGHPVNLGREAGGLRPANSIWLWGQGRSPRMVTLKERFGIEGYVISAVNLLKGIGSSQDWRSLRSPAPQAISIPIMKARLNMR
jgi:2,3-bisphosphoglycerate-independent phosphoglycerate mutase